MTRRSGRPRGRWCPEYGSRLKPRARPGAVFCSPACRARHWRMVRRTKARVAVIRSGPDGEAVCPVCGTPWAAGVERRADAVYCSPRCRTRAWRDRQAFAEPSQ
ncbi:hypothetical protein D7294_30710 [Streptomyces hoynatensis]|uniref:Uncharacterized protein n=1 Tax=Streptomyces hoynatensis TaxID=1141874 RepID=A0A3A9YFG1_9ACTN|nr:hypothetical protein D7294_30710 [Streptomyces hoynatensis]